MKLTVTIESSPDGLRCCATTDDCGISPHAVNLFAIGALEIAKASLLARRWGVNIGGFDQAPLVKPTLTKVPKRKKA